MSNQHATNGYVMAADTGPGRVNAKTIQNMNMHSKTLRLDWASRRSFTFRT